MRGKMNKLSGRERNLLYLLVALMILFGAYQFGYVGLMEKAENLQKSNQELTDQYNELLIKEAQKDKYITETARLNTMTQILLDRFPANLSQEKSIMLMAGLENYANIKVNALTFNGITTFYENDKSTDESSNDEENVPEGYYKETIENDLGSLTGYKLNMTINYKAGYKGLKKCIKFINENQEKMNISSITASYDSSTGNLTGTIGINIYALSSNLSKFEDIKIPVEEIGTNNIFGTIQDP